MAGRLLSLCSKVKTPVNPFGSAGLHHYEKVCIGNRDVVGYGVNGTPSYRDRVDFPFPALRWQENTATVQALREKEKGDWHKLSLEDKKALYRASFCQTFAEMKAPTGEWKLAVSGALVVVSLAFWVFMYYKTFVYSPLPETFSEESRKKQLRRLLDLEMNPIEGLASEWDYEKNQWKKK